MELFSFEDKSLCHPSLLSVSATFFLKKKTNIVDQDVHESIYATVGGNVEICSLGHHAVLYILM